MTTRRHFFMPRFVHAVVHENRQSEIWFHVGSTTVCLEYPITAGYVQGIYLFHEPSGQTVRRPQIAKQSQFWGWPLQGQYDYDYSSSFYYHKFISRRIIWSFLKMGTASCARSQQPTSHFFLPLCQASTIGQLFWVTSIKWSVPIYSTHNRWTGPMGLGKNEQGKNKVVVPESHGADAMFP